MAAMEQSKADEGLLNLVEDYKRENEQLLEKITELEKVLEQKDVELESLRDWAEFLALKQAKSDRELHQIRLELSNASTRELEQVLEKSLISDELHEARKELINGLTEITDTGDIGVKSVAELYFRPFLRAMEIKFSPEEAEIKALELWQLWREYLSDPDWYPFRSIIVDGENQQIIDVEDEKLKAVREQLGDEVYETVKMAVTELNNCNADIMSPELWNFSEGRKASLKEGIRAILANHRGITEECKKTENLAIYLDEKLEVKNQKLIELEQKCQNLIAEKDRLHESFSVEMRKMEFVQNKNLEHELEVLKNELSDKIEDYQEAEALNQVLTTKQRISNDELQNARKEALQVLRDVLNQRTTLRIKRMGEVDIKPFRELCLEKCLEREDLEERSATLCSSWQKEVENPEWQPFKIIAEKEIIDEDDAKLNKLREECGDVAYEAVKDALLEMNEYNASGRYIVSEIWNPKENRRATLKEILQYIIRQWQSNKLKRKRS